MNTVSKCFEAITQNTRKTQILSLFFVCVCAWDSVFSSFSIVDRRLRCCCCCFCSCSCRCFNHHIFFVHACTHTHSYCNRLFVRCMFTIESIASCFHIIRLCVLPCALLLFISFCIFAHELNETKLETTQIRTLYIVCVAFLWANVVILG